MTPYDAGIQIGRALICLAFASVGLYWSIIDWSWIAIVVLGLVWLMMVYSIIKAARILAQRRDKP